MGAEENNEEPMKKNVAVFCGARLGLPSYSEAAIAFMRMAHAEGWGLVYGGGDVGLMGVFADEMLRLGGAVIGVIPEHLVKWEVAHKGLADLRIVADMHARKKIMYDEAGAFVIFPGGIGTLDEFFEVLTWKQLGHHAKPVALFNVDGYYDGLLTWWERAVRDGLYSPEQMSLFTVCRTIEELNVFLEESDPTDVA